MKCLFGTALLLITLLNQSGLTNSQTLGGLNKNILLSLCTNLKFTPDHLRRCNNGDHLKGGQFFGDPNLTLRCWCLTYGYGYLFLQPMSNTPVIRMINSLG